jgi:hypothetical protein
MTDVSDMFLLCTNIGSLFSTLGETRRSKALDGDPALKGFDMAERGVGSPAFTTGERRDSMALDGVVPPDIAEAGVINWVLLDFDCSTRGVGEPFRSSEGDFGGTSGGLSLASSILLVSTFNVGLGLRIGESGFAIITDGSCLVTLIASPDPVDASFSNAAPEGPVTQAVRASPNGPVLQPGPGALLDLSWPNTASEAIFRSGGRPGIVATDC